MAVRNAYILEDVQECVYQFLTKLTTATSPWTAWQIQKGWPETNVLKHFSKPIIYIDAPLIPEDKKFQAGGLYNYNVSLILGVWNDRNTGGIEENNIACSHLVEKFLNAQDIENVTFNVTLGSTAYTATTLMTQGIRVQNIYGPREVSNPELKEFRRELELIVKI